MFVCNEAYVVALVLFLGAVELGGCDCYRQISGYLGDTIKIVNQLCER